MARTRRSRPAPSREPAAVNDSELGQLPTSGSAGNIRDRQNLNQTQRQSRRTRTANTASTPLDANHGDALEVTGAVRDVAMRRLAAEDGPTSSSTNAARDSDEGMDVSVEVGRKAHATPAQHRRDTTGLDLDDSLFGSLDNSFEHDDDAAAPPSGQRSTDTSTMNTSVFRRRGRAPSISLQGNEAPIRPSSRGQATPAISSSFNIGMFKRRAREPSILGTAQKERAERAIEISSASSSEDEDEDEEDFAPEAESTPLNRRKTLQRSSPTGRLQETEASSPDRDSRKRKSIEGHDMSSRPDKVARTSGPDLDGARHDAASDAASDAATEAALEAALEAADSDDDSNLSSLPSLPSPELPPLQMHRPSTPIDQEAIMAPPESSGSEEEEEDNAWPDIRELAKRRRHHPPVTPLRDGHVSDISSPPSLTHSPNNRVTRGRQQEKKKKKKQTRQSSPHVTTAVLTDLLPRRRHEKNRDEHDDSESELDVSSLGNDDDELTYLDARATRRRGRTTPHNRGAPSNAHSAGTSKPGRPRRTYQRRFSDKENGGGEEGASSLTPAPDDTFDTAQSSDPRNSVEIKNAIKKFKEVDKWELAFEEMTQSSSSTTGR
ncbi:hypothetical protein SODALDRAFT_328372 [Sodiomyces alkalinus F11]|uniref:Uncharacterized protein n=1 Tax=Sodiomyces alkalinus (strain CBS 110278 / VKM F-3762 / F11) TaxID=1314773 RepID=A0A3N2PN96_SODAK|nr:hypothetical protein SODALDRAFT_328372 [Sodiomyces alkalinus F11]ROT35995.1 hypothetical protein SODALDRAFT_328372 [Sodiomyces alkalinus F11]